MIRLAIAGTNWITDQFIEAALKTQSTNCGAYSRSLDKAREFSEKHGSLALYDDFDAFAKCSSIDAVYIASLIHFMHLKQ